MREGVGTLMHTYARVGFISYRMGIIIRARDISRYCFTKYYYYNSATYKKSTIKKFTIKSKWTKNVSHTRYVCN